MPSPAGDHKARHREQNRDKIEDEWLPGREPHWQRSLSRLSPHLGGAMDVRHPKDVHHTFHIHNTSYSILTAHFDGQSAAKKQRLSFVLKAPLHK